ncbi:MAG TPA: amino acid-binding ACT domain-containing protein [Gammaproteobacteria bacterium]
MKDLCIQLANAPGALAAMGDALGKAGVSVEGGGAWLGTEDSAFGIAHFLFEDGVAASRALQDAGIDVLGVRDVILTRLKQDTPGQLGALTRRMAEAGVNIEVLYSDHTGNLVLVVDDINAAQTVSDAWSQR